MFAGVSATPKGLRGLQNSSTNSSNRSLLGSASSAQPGCCGGCPTSFCSPNSGTCYDQKGKDYYLACNSNRFPSCCNSCGQSAFCSPNSGTCYDQKGKDYYLACNSNRFPSCCNSCGQSAFCSPNSGRCYDAKGKDYYLECALEQPSEQPAASTQAPEGGMTFYYAGHRGCNFQTSNRLTYLTTSSAGDCRGACQGTPGCSVFIYSFANNPCGMEGECQLFQTCQAEENPCWQQFVLD